MSSNVETYQRILETFNRDGVDGPAKVASPAALVRSW
jgi:hypothetical protein